MPEEQEVDSRELAERAREEADREGSALLRRIALTTAVLAAFTVIAALEASDTINEAIVLKTEATRLQAQASDVWAHYQAKTIKSLAARGAAAAWEAAGRAVPPAIADEVRQHAEGTAELEREARDRERERDERSSEADALLARHGRFAEAVALFQLAIALGAVAALTRLRPVLVLSMLLGGAGLVFLALPFLA
jgi:hypothetical protein